MSRSYIPNEIPFKERLRNILLSVFLFAYGLHGVWVNDLYIPGKRSRGAHLHDLGAWAMYGAMLCACLVMLSIVVDHYDRRDNERHYREFSDTAVCVGSFLVLVSITWSLVH